MGWGGVILHKTPESEKQEDRVHVEQPGYQEQQCCPHREVAWCGEQGTEDIPTGGLRCGEGGGSDVHM
jgi:hypothetical protein